MRNKIYFDDLVILKIIQDNEGELSGVPIRNMAKKANEWLAARKVPDNYCPSFSSGHSPMQRTLSVLEKLGLISKLGFRKGSRSTDKAAKLFEELGGDWRGWFLSAPIKDGEIVFDQATYADTYREAL